MELKSLKFDNLFLDFSLCIVDISIKEVKILLYYFILLILKITQFQSCHFNANRMG